MDPALLYRDHHVAVFRYLLRRTGDRGAAEELMQECFVRVVRHAGDYDERGHASGWLFGIARNLASNWERGRARRPTEPLGEHAGEDADAGATMQLERVLAGLPELERELLLLREVAGLDYREIAEATGTSVAAVRSRLFRARATARALLTADPVAAAIGDER